MSKSEHIDNNLNSHNSNMDRYKQLVNEEDVLMEKLNTCEKISEAIHHTIFKQGNSLHILTVGEILNLIFEVESNINMELLHNRLAKSVLAWKIDVKQ